MDTKILRSPDYSASSIVLKTGNEVELIKNKANEHAVKDVIKQAKVKSQEDYHLEYASKLAELETQKKRLDEYENELLKKQNQLDDEKELFKARLEQEVCEKLENKFALEASDLRTKIVSLVDAIEVAKNQALSNMQDEISLIVYEATCKVIGKVVTDKEVVISIVREVVKHAQDRMRMTIRVSPVDYELIQESKEIISRGLSNRVDVVADDHINYGGCIVETDAGSIDGRLDQQLAGLLDLISSYRTNKHGH